jgi:Protein of unknown function (DUF1592)/Protein of unknown function (DUF1588)/Protein of unknown function (DUF1587)/Protein of unknown function (DUF1585)/Protein of unknown function (DUF1595)/Planctomycete cytochrome C
MQTRLGVAAALACAGPLLAATGQADDSPFETTVQPFLSRNCYSCHDSRSKNADVNLEVFTSRASMLADPDTWQKVMSKMSTGQMPPPGRPRPDEAAVRRIVDWIASELDRAELAAPPDPGHVTARRLNRTEYDNTVRDLLGVDLRPAEDFPQDDTGYGFDNNGDVLSLSPALMERYVMAAERVARAAVFGPPPARPALVRLQSRRGKIPPSATVPAAYDAEGLSLPNSLHAQHRFAAGDYVLRAILGGTRPAGSEPLRVGLFLDGRQVEVRAFDPEGTASFAADRPDYSGKVVEFKTRVPAGEHWVAASIVGLYDGLPASYGGANPSRRPLPPPPAFKPRPGASPEQVEAARKAFEERLKEIPPANDARVSQLEVAGPYDPPRGPSSTSLQRVYACGHLDGHHGRGCLRRILTEVAHRAYRRPVSARDVEPLVALAAQARGRGESFEDALSLALQAVLVSPDFLFRIEQDPPPSAAEGSHPIGLHEMASRLSYFLWASLPDDTLLGAADAGTLRRPDVLAAQVRRMLADPKASALVEAFGGQWLQFRALESKSPDRERFPLFDDNLRLSMVRETELFLGGIVREDRSILELLDAPYTFLNERLARHYDIAGVTGPEFRKVELGGTARGGILTQGSVLTVSSYATRTSPVLRGKWILENVFNAPPPEPPAGTPRLDEATVGATASLRAQLEAHRTSSTCMACHSRMDPLGFALENFDAVGAWRTQDGAFPLDVSGTLPDGRTFSGPGELRRILSGDRQAFAQCVTAKLLTYALGRGLERYDRRTVNAIADKVAHEDYRFSALVLEIVNSLPFRMQRGRAGAS